ncbi:MAG: hypothetical protein IID35_08805 [Planctomycetes bacterium]|nr:hypothetical protein [Planctomycetota bacterium]
MSRWSDESAAKCSALRSRFARRSTIDKSTVAAAVTVLCASGLSAVAGPTDGMTIRLTPIARTIDGCYGPVEDETCSGLGYGEDDIFGQELRVHDGGFLVYLELQLEGWGSTGRRLRTYQAKILYETFGSGAGAPLELFSIPCASTADCESTHGEKGPKCIGGVCEPAWINKTRTDMVFFDQLQNDCVAAFDRSHSPLLFFAVAATNPSDTEFCSEADKGIIYYAGTLALWVPPGAAGTYTIGFIEVETFAFDDTLDPAPIEIPVTTLAAVINIIGEDCNGNDVHDETDIADGTSFDVNGNDVPDECETDCQPNGEFDFREIRSGQSQDCNDNDIPDECDILDDESDDCNTNGVPDECDISSWDSRDRNRDGVPDECQAVPAVSTWGLVILTLLMAVGLALKFDRPTPPFRAASVHQA